jgi:hypothetical protein
VYSRALSSKIDYIPQHCLDPTIWKNHVIWWKKQNERHCFNYDIGEVDGLNSQSKVDVGNILI